MGWLFNNASGKIKIQLKNILWLASWYPNYLDRYDGDFIQRHAKAVSQYCKVHVIHVKKDDQLAADETATEIQESGNLTGQVIYYNSTRTGVKLIDRILSQRRFNKVYRHAISEYIKSTGKPALVHLHVAMKAGTAALWIKQKWNIPFIISEHWTGYLPTADVSMKSFSRIYQTWLRKVVTQASVITVVSDYLGKSMKVHFPSIEYLVIPNVVDTTVFYPSQIGRTGRTKFVHISNMTFQKNAEAILKALKVLKADADFEMHLYGAFNKELKLQIENSGLQHQVFIKGEVPQPELAVAIRHSDALVLYSRFETFGCVLIEANACGVPVIVSDIEVFHELVEEGINGIFVPEDDPEALAEKLFYFISRKDDFNKMAIAEAAAEKYNFKKIGQQFDELYDSVLTGKTSSA